MRGDQSSSWGNCLATGSRGERKVCRKLAANRGGPAK